MEEQYKDIKRLVKEVGTEHPSVDFLKNVMSEIKIASVNKSITYQPLISKKTWLVMGILIIGLLISLPFFSEEASILDKVDFSFLNGFKSPFAGFKLHSATTYGIIFLAVLFMVQITVLKRRIDKMYSM
ncbi:hypothetical protein [uncultured Aquimarina sp.]|uniref:hypothetical protein n=1 Tax=uncultured Aquimarina sp. TaxID=575652 RepID=UPI0026272DC9|nr:hypothetical protein [uncultured Aquimarina sp.]